jgi:hypothetical protein
VDAVKRAPHHEPQHGEEIADDRDRGGALILALVMIILGATVVLPTLSYTMAVTRQSRVAMTRTAGDEAVKGGLRTALADPGKLYLECQGGSRTTVHPIATAIPNVSTSCSWLSEAYAKDSTQIPYSVATVQAGSAVPSDAWPPATSYPSSGNSDTHAWVADTTPTSTGSKIFAPYLPAHALSHPSPTGYPMPAPFPACTVFFPGTYPDPINITSATPTFFASGIYYFESSVTISGSATVVVGDGATEGCTTDQEAAFNAVNAPVNHNITGVGATFIFGKDGRLLINDSTPGTGVSVKFNNRYVGPTDVSTASSAGVSIMTVNGEELAPPDISDLERPGQLYVPASWVGGATPAPATSPNYDPSTNISSADPLTPSNPIVDITLSTGEPVTVLIPGYTSAPQGTVNVNTTDPAAAAGKDIEIGGGVLAAQTIISTQRPATFIFGAINAVVQKTFKLVTTTTDARSVSTAIVQVNSIGTYYVNSWEVQAN